MRWRRSGAGWERGRQLPVLFLLNQHLVGDDLHFEVGSRGVLDCFDLSDSAPRKMAESHGPRVQRGQ